MIKTFPLYTGPGGPLRNDVIKFGQLLLQELLALGHTTATYNRVDSPYVDGETMDVVEFEGRAVVYDRWGFCAVDPNNNYQEMGGGDIVDQMGVVETYKYLVGLKD